MAKTAKNLLTVGLCALFVLSAVLIGALGLAPAIAETQITPPIYGY